MGRARNDHNQTQERRQAGAKGCRLQITHCNHGRRDMTVYTGPAVYNLVVAGIIVATMIAAIALIFG